jgi:hypothetical protein
MSDRSHGAPIPSGFARRIRRSMLTSLSRTSLQGGLAAFFACMMLSPSAAQAFNFSFIGPFHTVSTIGGTVPSNGDLNPYGIVTVPSSTGSLVRGDLLISNFNDAKNLQGTGTTIVQISPGGGFSEFAHINPETLRGPCPGGVGLTTALAVLPNGYVVVGSLPTTDGKAATAEAGCLIVLNSAGHPVETISGPPINGPWDMTALTFGDDAVLFVTNVLNGTVAAEGEPTNGGTVVRITLHTGEHRPPVVTSERVIATGFPERTDPGALVVGPTGVALGIGGTLYVADTQGNRIAAVPNALFRQARFGGGGITVAKGGFLNNPLGLTIAPNGDVLTANANDGNIVETGPFGGELRAVDTGAGGGGLFGLTVSTGRPGVYFVNDTENTLDLLH